MPEDDVHAVIPANDHSVRSDMTPPNGRPPSAARRATNRRRTRRELATALPSLAEVTTYTLLGAAIASTVFVVGGRPYWHVALVVLSALVIILLSALVSRRAVARADRPNSPTSEAEFSHPPPPTSNSRRGRRRRR